MRPAVHNKIFPGIQESFQLGSILLTPQQHRDDQHQHGENHPAAGGKVLKTLLVMSSLSLKNSDMQEERSVSISVKTIFIFLKINIVNFYLRVFNFLKILCTIIKTSVNNF